jgi:acyl transferase domain-containing protein
MTTDSSTPLKFISCAISNSHHISDPLRLCEFSSSLIALGLLDTRILKAGSKYGGTMSAQVEGSSMRRSREVPLVAIVGMAMRLPGGVNTGSDFWDLLVTGSDGHCRVPGSRYNARSHSSPADLHTVRTEYGYFLCEDPARFDAKFFDLPARQAAALDPRQRLLAEVVWECMENAGQTDWSGSGQKIGCYVGVFGNDWMELAMQDTQDFSYNRIACTMDFISNSISYVFDLTGPR